MNTEQLQSFLTVAALGGFRAAALRLNISQPALSARVRSLEDRLNRRLFERSRHGVTLTAAGRTFHRYAISALRILEQGRQEATLDARFRGHVAFGVQFYLWEALAEPWIERMTAAAPDLALRVEPDFSEGIVTRMADGALDFGVLFEPRLGDGIVVEPLPDEPLILVSADAAVTGDSWKENYVAVYWGQAFLDAFPRSIPDPPRPRLSVGLSTLGLGHVLRNGGSGYFLERSARPHLDAGTLHRVPGAPTLTRPLFLAYRETLADSPDHAIAIGVLKDILSDKPSRTP